MIQIDFEMHGPMHNELKEYFVSKFGAWAWEAIEIIYKYFPRFYIEDMLFYIDFNIKDNNKICSTIKERKNSNPKCIHINDGRYQLIFEANLDFVNKTLTGKFGHNDPWIREFNSAQDGWAESFDSTIRSIKLINIVEK